ncbi:MAG: SDR family NAD(P)-dependent oxidoreductase [Candidatus Aenigmatarchaeota archaeon]
MRAVVTGGAGFIGSALVRKLLDSGCEVTVMDNLGSGNLGNLAPLRERIGFHDLDVRLKSRLAPLLKGADVVFHLAGISSVPASISNPRETFDVNLSGSLNVLEAALANNVRKVVFASSAAIYGIAEPPLREEMGPDCRSPYAVSKLAVESLMSMYAKEHAMGTVSLRLFNVYGPRQNPESSYAVVPRFLKAALTNRTVAIQGDGDQTRDFVYVEDVTEAMLAAAKAQTAGEVLNIGTGHSVTINELAKKILDLTGSRSEITHGPEREGDVRYSCADVSLARKLLGWKPEWDISRGLEATVKFSKASQRDASE